MNKLPPVCRKRLINDLKLLKSEPVDYIDAMPNITNPLIWHFIIQGPPYSIYKGGYYIGQIEYTSKYPYAPPDYKMLTPSGRFHINDKICITNSGYHKNQWSPGWTLRGTLAGFLSIMLDDAVHGLSHITGSSEKIDANKRKLAQESVQYNKTNYLHIIKNFDRFFDKNGDPKENTEDDNKTETNLDEEIQPKKEKKPKRSKRSKRKKKSKKEKSENSNKEVQKEDTNDTDEEIKLKRNTRKTKKKTKKKSNRTHHKRLSNVKIIEDVISDVKQNSKKLLLEYMDNVDFTSADECIKMYNLWKDNRS